MNLKKADRTNDTVVDLAEALGDYFSSHSRLGWARVDTQDATIVVGQGTSRRELQSVVGGWSALGAEAIVSPSLGRAPAGYRVEPRLVYPGHVLIRTYPDGNAGCWAAFLEYHDGGRIAFGEGIVATLRALADRIEQEGMPDVSEHVTHGAAS